MEIDATPTARPGTETAGAQTQKPVFRGITPARNTGRGGGEPLCWNKMDYQERVELKKTKPWFFSRLAKGQR